MEKLAITGLFIIGIILLFSGAGPDVADGAPAQANESDIAWFPKIDLSILEASPNADFIPGLKGYQQSTDYTCGPAALLSLAKFYNLPGIDENVSTEMRIARELGTRDFNSSKPGTNPQEMASWLQKNGFDVRLDFEDRGDGSALQHLRANIRRGIPTLVEWIDLSGHWAIAVGYDYRNVSDPWDDVLILADPYDRYDDHMDGYSFVNANRFYWMWFDALYFDNITWRTMITATPEGALRQRSSYDHSNSSSPQSNETLQ
ncbi:MAG TPA: peptidase C39 family protein [Methanotrichaceae archaeon]|nr:peptidase C39 family protein [Methanotrichaceae archaeon]